MKSMNPQAICRFVAAAVAAAAACGSPVAAAAETAPKPLKVFILAGQSNMQGHAHVSTFPAIGLDPATAPMLEAMTDDDGGPVTLDTVWISEIGSGPDGGAERHGKLDATYGAANRGPKIGPEYTFGIYMARHLGDEPVLLIKTAWGGKRLNTDFRPPSAGPYNDWARPDDVSAEDKQARAEASGVYYRKMIEHVKEVLADPKAVCPAYDPAAGYEIAGFVWFQGWNDMVDRGTYPNRNQPDGYALYAELLATFIRDVRKDLDTPGLPFVIGVLGVDGVATPASEAARAPRYRGIKPALEKAMSAPARMPEFEGTVAAVMTGRYWDHELDAVLSKRDERINRVVSERAKAEGLGREAQQALREELEAEHLTDRDRQVLQGKSNQGFHYHGSAKILGGIGKGFAEAMIELMQAGR